MPVSSLLANRCASKPTDADSAHEFSKGNIVFLCPDTAQLIVAGSDPVRIMSPHRERVACIHWRDAVGPAPADTRIDDTIYSRQLRWYTSTGEGVVDWPAWMRLLRDMRYRGWAQFELDLAADPIGELRKSRQYVENALSHIYQ